MTWQPTASFDVLRQRAAIIAAIRQFFKERNVLEVETPALSPAGVTDPHIHSIPAEFQELGSSEKKILYLQTSPEYAMKRLLAAGSGCVYQISKAFRQGEKGRLHNPEFTMLEWYRIGFDHHALMDEMDLLLQLILKTELAKRFSYADVFLHYTQMNPHLADEQEIKTNMKRFNILLNDEISDKNDLLDLLLTHVIEPKLKEYIQPVFIYDFPVSQAALARIRHHETPPVASRFEVYFKGIELANGFHELQDAKEQRTRFENDLSLRKKMSLPAMPVDELLLAALTHGLPNCAGVALGVDRLVMLAVRMESIQQATGFNLI